MAAPLNYTTKIPAKRTAGECLDLLAEAGADHVSVTYADREPVGLAFDLRTAGGRRTFTLPVNVDGALTMLRKAEKDGRLAGARKAPGTYTGRAHAANVAWRVIKDWLEAQLAIIEAQMATLDQVMLPYLEVDPGLTLYERYLALDGQVALTGGA